MSTLARSFLSFSNQQFSSEYPASVSVRARPVLSIHFKICELSLNSRPGESSNSRSFFIFFLKSHSRWLLSTKFNSIRAKDVGVIYRRHVDPGFQLRIYRFHSAQSQPSLGPIRNKTAAIRMSCIHLFTLDGESILEMGMINNRVGL